MNETNFLDESFTIDDDHKAEWAIKKMAETNAEAKRIADVCNQMIADYEQKRDEALEKAEKDNAFFQALLERYFNTVPHKITKTQESYLLPSGKLVRKQQNVGYEYEDADLLGVCKDNEYMKPYVKVTEKVAWSELKKAIKALPTGEVVLDATGEILPCIKAVFPEPKFEVKIN